MKQTARGFTIVELLIVIVVIAILAAVTIVAYNGIQNRAKQSAAQSAVSQTAKRVLSYAIENADSYPTSLSAINVANSSDTSFQYTVSNTVPRSFCVTATSGTFSYYVSNTVTKPTSGGCPGHGQGGVPPITNLATNPSFVSSNSTSSCWGGNGGGVTSSTSVAAAWSLRGRALRCTWTVSNTTLNGDGGVNAAAWLQPNTQYTASWRVQVSKAQRIGPAASNWFVSGGGAGSGSTQASTPAAVIPANTPTDQYITFTTGPNTVTVKFYSNLNSGTGAVTWNAGDWLEISEVMLVEGSTVRPYADGDSTNWAWTGTQNASSSTGPPL